MFSMRFWLRCAAVLAILLLVAARADARGCVAEGTLIATPTGATPVQSLQVGDVVLGVEGNRLQPARVVGRFVVDADVFLELHAGPQTLRVTAEHPIEIAPGLFREAAQLHAGDTVWLKSADEDWPHPQRLESIRRLSSGGRAYNLMVSPGGTYLAAGIVVHNKGCFLPDTPILRPDGTQTPISQIRPGDRVAAFTPDGGLVSPLVQAVMTIGVQEYCRVATDAGTLLDVTAEHPFYIGDGTFKTLDSLHVGDRIFAYDQHTGWSRQRIAAIDHIARPAIVYNLQTDGPHTFFAHGIAVHNKGGGGGGHGGGFGGGWGGGYSSHYYYHSGGGYYSSTRPSAADEWVCPAVFVCFFVVVFISGIVNSVRQQGVTSSVRSVGTPSARWDELDYVFPAETVRQKARPTTELLQRLAQRDALMDPVMLSELVRSTFVKLQDCWENRDYRPMQPLLMPDLYQTHLAQLNAMVAQHEINRISELVVEQIDLVHVRYTRRAEQREFTALITARARDYYVDDRSGQFLRGDRGPTRFQEFWIFHLMGDVWLLREIEQSRESDALRRPNVAETTDPTDSFATAAATAAAPQAAVPPAADVRFLGRDSRVHQLLDRLSQTDPDWDADRLSSLARHGMVAVLLAEEQGQLNEETRQLLTATLAQAVQKQIAAQQQAGEAVQYRNLCVRKVELVLVRALADAARSQFVARVTCHAQKIVSTGGTVTRQDPYELQFVQYLVFTRREGPWKLDEILPPGSGDRVLDLPNIAPDQAW